MGGKSQQQDTQENLRILMTQIEAINQQLAGGRGGGGGGPAMTTALQQVETKLNYLYELTKAVQSQISSSEQEYFEQVGSKVTTALNQNLTQLFSKLQEMHSSFEQVKQNLQNSPAIEAKDIMEMKQTLASLIDVYKDEVKVFRQQNEYLQKKLDLIEKKIDAMSK